MEAVESTIALFVVGLLAALSLIGLAALALFIGGLFIGGRGR